MKVPRDVTGTEAVRALRRLGFESIRPGTLRGMLDQAGVTLEAFAEAL